MESVSDRYRVVAPDLHGYGRSDPLPEDGKPFFVHDAGIVWAFLESDGPAHIVGHSLGGAVALAAARRPESILSLTLIEPVLFGLLIEADDPEQSDPLPMARALKAGLDAGRPDEAARAFVAFWSGQAAFDAMPPKVQDYTIKTIARVYAEFEGLQPEVPGALSLSDAKALPMPVHVVLGGATRSSAKAIAELLKKTIRQVEVTEISGAAHMAAVTEPELINPKIAAFLDAHC